MTDRIDAQIESLEKKRIRELEARVKHHVEVGGGYVTRCAELERALWAWVKWQNAVRQNQGNTEAKGALLRTALVLTKGVLVAKR